MEAAGLDAEMPRDFPIQRGQGAERTIGGVARPGAQPLADLALEHQHHACDQVPMLGEFARNGSRHVKGQIANHLDRRMARELRQIDLQEVGFDQVEAARKPGAQPRRQFAVQFDQVQPRNRSDQDALAKDAQSRPDLHNLVVGAELRHRDNSIGDRTLDQEILPAPLARGHPRSTQRAARRIRAGDAPARHPAQITFASHSVAYSPTCARVALLVHRLR